MLVFRLAQVGVTYLRHYFIAEPDGPVQDRPAVLDECLAVGGKSRFVRRIVVSSNNRQASTRTIYDGSLIRLSDIEVGYTLRSDKLKDLGCSSIRFYLVGNNIWMHSNWDMLDPETGSANGSAYPLSRKINLGVKMNF